MKTRRREVWLVPVTFGFGPASHALAIAAALRHLDPEVIIGAVADGAAHDFLRRSGGFDRMLVAPEEMLPDSDDIDARATVVSVGDFGRALEAKRRGLRVVLVDALYWMWNEDPIDTTVVDEYLCLAFPGVEERISASNGSAPSVRVIPQILGGPLPPVATERRGVILNLGGAVTPFGVNPRYLSALTQTVAQVVADVVGEELRVTCSARVREALWSHGLTKEIRVQELSWPEMMRGLATNSLLLSVPGLSIVWEAGVMGIPTIFLPGSNYSQHQQSRSYRGISTLVSWDEIPGFSTLPSGMPEREGVTGAIAVGNRFADAAAAQDVLADRLRCIIGAGGVTPPRVGAGSFRHLDGARHVAARVLYPEDD